MGFWSTQKVNLGGLTTGVAAVCDPFICLYGGSQNVIYRAADGSLQNCYFDGVAHWQVYQINLGGSTTGAAAIGSPSVSIYGTELHVMYRAAGGTLLDCWWDGIGVWRVQQINLGGLTAGPAAQGDPFVSVRLKEQHVMYRDAGGTLFDSYFDGQGNWRVQQINLGGLTKGPATESDPCVSVYNNSEQHVFYRAAGGTIMDCWFDGVKTWRVQQINLGGLTKGPAAAGDPYVSTIGQEQHVFYRDTTGTLFDCWFGVGTWRVQQVNLGGLTNGQAAVGDPSACVYGSEQHVLYSAAGGTILDCWFDGVRTWRVQQINLAGLTPAAAAVGVPVGTVDGTEQDVFYRTSDGSIVECWYTA